MNKKNNTETLSIKGFYIDEMKTIDALTYMLEDQLCIFSELKKTLPDIDKVVGLMYEHINSKPKAHIIYCGAGTSGRIGVQDGTEIFPTFGWPKEKVKYIIAGGYKAVFEAVGGKFFQLAKAIVPFLQTSLLLRSPERSSDNSVR